MKKINSNRYAHKIIGIALLFLIVLPLCFYLFSLFLNISLFKILIQITLGIGLLILIFLLGLLVIEFHQDKIISRQHENVKRSKIKIGEGIYECQFCGNRQIIDTDISCGICGIHFCS